MVCVIVRRECTDDFHAIALGYRDQFGCRIRWVDDEAFARSTIANEIGKIHHLPRDGIVVGEVPTRKHLAEIERVGGAVVVDLTNRHRRTLPVYDTSMLRADDRVLVDGVLVEIGPEIAESFRSGDRLFGVDGTRLLHVPRDVDERVADVVRRSIHAFAQLQESRADRVTLFYREFASALRDPATIEAILSANALDLDRARSMGRSTTRLAATPTMLADMATGLDLWAEAEERPNATSETLHHQGWQVEVVRAPLGVVAFVFEGRPNVFSDATGVLRMGNTCVFRIGRDALNTARSIMDVALRPSLSKADLPADAILLVDEPSHAAAWSLFSQKGVALAVARGSGAAVRDLGAVARQSGVPVSLHGTGGAWILVAEDAEIDTIEQIVASSLDRKVCNTANVVVIIGENPGDRVRAVIKGAQVAAQNRDTTPIVHDLTGMCHTYETNTEVVPGSTYDLSIEWEWEDRPEFSLCLAASLHQAVSLFNAHSPRFVVSVLSGDDEKHAYVWAHAIAPFVGNGMTRWVDGQFALKRPELGLANWELGAQIGRGAILSGGDVFTVRYRVDQNDPRLHR